jgi:4-hydroxybenzoate polyprenyltransferase
MIQRVFIFLKTIRAFESALMTGFPLIGLIVALTPGAFESPIQLIGTATLFCFSTFFLVIYVYCLNSWGGIEADRLNERLDDHPVLTGEISERQLRFISYFGLVANLVLYAIFFPQCFVLAPFIAIVWTFYSHPRLMGKARPFAGTILHFIGGVLQILLGYVVVSGFDTKGILISIYFSLVFSAGHLNHEVKDHDADLVAGLKTNAVVFGPRKMLIFAFGVFSAAFCYLFALTVGGVISWSESWPFLAIYPIHLVLHRRMMEASFDTVYDKRYQRNYRLLFLGAGIILLITKLTQTF